MMPDVTTEAEPEVFTVSLTNPDPLAFVSITDPSGSVNLYDTVP